MTETDELLTLQEAADELKVHYMTAYRWVRKGDLEAFKAGGRLRVRREALEAYITARQVATGVGASEHGSRRDWPHHVDRLCDLLVRGEAQEANAVVRKIISDGATAGEVYTRLLTPCLHHIGELWERGEVNVAIEHRATEICTGIMNRLSEHFRRRGPRRGVAVTLTAPGEDHGVASAMIADFLRASGWEVHHLGTNVPIDDLRLFLDIIPAHVVCVSAGQQLRPQVYEDLAAACAGRQLIMGGRGTDLSIAEPLGITVLEDPIALVEHLEETA
ncbi:helix-turn-helix domain-containing protein [Euzebya sp.]|uniref:helix-turn-helix domain-containing protein n=1 Tax=Euzebya sp. TaxID=1971409 RepID=UPI0035192B27